MAMLVVVSCLILSVGLNLAMVSVGYVRFGFGCVGSGVVVEWLWLFLVLAVEWRWGGCGDGVTVVVFGCVVAGGGGCGLLKGFCGGYVLFYFNEFFILF